MANDESGIKKYYTEECAYIIAEMINKSYNNQLDVKDYGAEVKKKVKSLELKDRVFVLADGLRKRLPDDYPTAIHIIVDSLGDELGENDGMFNDGWFLMPIARFVEEFGLDYPKESMEALEEITKRHTAEFAVRPFIEKYYDSTMKIIKKWAMSPNFHLRRAASEGIRPRLPWASKLQCFIKDPQPVLEVLEVLRSDSSEYVRKSVGNNLNDISKDWPEVVMDTLERWKVESPTKETMEITKRALRGLIKAGNQRALTIIGATGGKKIKVSNLTISPTHIQIGESIQIDLDVANPTSTEHSLTIDYVIYLVRSNGKTSKKIFRLASVKLNAKECRHITKKHTMKTVSVRTYYSGYHQVDIIVNGLIKGSVSFELQV